MTRAVIPIANLQRRIPEAGRIRIGVKTAKALKALDVFRFTSPDRQALDAIAAAYGGEVREWKEPKAAPGQHEVITEANELAIVLPPDPLSGSPVYEMWGGGGCERRCDGLTCERIVKGVDGAERVDVPCLCNEAGTMACEPHTRLNVILPEVRFTGVWRLESKSWNVAHEFPGFVDLIESIQQKGLTRGVLRLEHRTSLFAGQTRRFVVPVLGVAESMDALAAGMAGVSSLGEGPDAPALGQGSPCCDLHTPVDCCDPDDCGPCCKNCPTCPTLARRRGQGSSSGDAPVEMQAGDAGPTRASAAHASPDDDIIDAEIVDRTLADVVPADVTDGQALLAARNVYKRHDESPPTELAQVTNPARIAAVLDELGLLGSAP